MVIRRYTELLISHKRRRRGTGKDSIKEYYCIDEDENKKKKRKREEDIKEESADESEGEEELMDLESEAGRRKSEKPSEQESEKESKSESAKSEEEDIKDVSEEEEVEHTGEEEEDTYEDDGPEIVEENITNRGRGAISDFHSNGQKVTVTTNGPTDHDSFLQSRVESLLRNSKSVFRVVISQMNEQDYASRSHVFTVAIMQYIPSGQLQRIHFSWTPNSAFG